MNDPVNICYVYCVVPASFEMGEGIAGIDAAAVRLVTSGDIAALVSPLDATVYQAGAIEQHMGDLQWLEPRAIAHDRVVTWASDRAPAIPMPMWTVFSDEEAVKTILCQRGDALRANLALLRDAREYTVRVFVAPGEIATSVGALSPRLSELERSIAGAPPGQAYLLRRKLDAERKTEVRAVAHRIADETYDVLFEYSTQGVREPLPRAEEGGGVLAAVLNASFLVANPRYDDFRRALTGLIERYTPAGFRFDFTGPWPAYHFVRNA